MASVRELVRWPVIQAPMGGGPSRPVLAAAVSDAGGLGFLAAGYKTADEVALEIAATKRLTGAPFGVNVFVPYRPPVDEAALGRYLADLENGRVVVGVSLGPSEWSDDEWTAKLDVLLRDPVPVVSFAFGCPSREIVSAAAKAGLTGRRDDHDAARGRDRHRGGRGCALLPRHRGGRAPRRVHR